MQKNKKIERIDNSELECSSGKAFIEEWLLVTIITFIMINRQFKHLANGNFYRGFWGIAGTIWIQKYRDYKKKAWF